MTGLALAREQHLQHGADVVFTYGPWGVLNAPMHFDESAVWLGAGFRALAVGLLLGALLWCLPSHRWQPWVAAALALLIGNCSTAGWMLVLSICAGGLALLAGFKALNPALLCLGAVASALLIQVKTSEGMLALAVVGLVALSSMRPMLWLTSAASFVGAFAMFWLAAQQSLANIGTWLRLSVELVGGYSGAMVYLQPDALTVVMMVAVAVTTLTVLFARSLPLASKVCALGVVLFMSKASLTLAEPGHLIQGYTGLFVVLVVASRGATKIVLRGAALGMATILASTMLRTPVILARDSTFSWPGDANSLIPRARESLADELGIEPRLLALLRGHPVSIDPVEISAAWAYGLDWHPVPIFQRYSAYTPTLDRANASALMADPNHRVLREPYDGISFGQSPRYVKTLLCNFDQIGVGSHWSVLARAEDRCGAEQGVSKRRIESGELVVLPAPVDAMIAMRFEPDERSVLDRAIALAGPQRHLITVDVGGELVRLPEALADGPLIVAAPSFVPMLVEDQAPATVSFNRGGVLEIVEIPLSGRESG